MIISKEFKGSFKIIVIVYVQHYLHQVIKRQRKISFLLGWEHYLLKWHCSVNQANLQKKKKSRTVPTCFLWL